MFELMICSLVTILPDYLFRRYRQGKRIGHEITLYSVWFELRWGITGCVILTLSLITLIFYYHPSTSTVSSFFRTVTILPEAGGRVAEVYVDTGDSVSVGDPIFRLDDSQQQAAVESARTRVAELTAQLSVAAADLEVARGGVSQAEGSLQQAVDELEEKQELQQRNSGIVSERELEQLQNVVDSRSGALAAATAQVQAAEAQLSVLLPAQIASAEAGLAEAEVALSKTLVVAGVEGSIQQFVLQPGDYVSPVLRPAGLLVPNEYEEGFFRAGFSQLAAQVIKTGMVVEVACMSAPFRIVPMQVTSVQDVIAAGQFRPTDNLLELTDRARPGTIVVRMEPIYPEQADPIPPGSACVAYAYTNNHDKLSDPEVGGMQAFALHAIDTVGLVHALLLRIHVLLLPMQTLVLTGGH